jgi:hypothetical protein
LRIVIAEYPKSGGSWITGLIGDALGLPKRDIYFSEEYKSFNFWKHPWYRGVTTVELPDACVIKSHELPDSQLHNVATSVVHLVRDGRDVVVSKYFFERDFCVKNGVYKKFDEDFDHYVKRVSGEWNRFVLSWIEKGIPFVRYEDFLTTPMDAVQRTLDSVGMKASTQSIVRALEENTKAKVHASLDATFQYNTFVRKGVAGDWRNHFDDDHIIAFRQNAGEAFARLGYTW